MREEHLLADATARERALDVTRSFIVQAPAGSGKTDLLVKRYIKLLGVVEKPEEILAITFTIKAAAEMKARITQTLGKGDIAPRLRIQTIDAFCTGLTRQMPVLSRFGAQPAIVEEAGEHYREAASRTLIDLSPQVERVLAHLDNNVETATSLIAAMLARRDQWLRKTGTAPTRKELEAALVFERQKLLTRAKTLHPKSSAEWAAEKLTKEFTWRKADPEAQALSGNEELRRALQALLCMPPERREGLGNVRLEPLTLTTNFRSQGKLVDFFNSAFPRIFPAEPDESLGAVPYSAATPNDPALPGEAVTWHNPPDRKAEAETIIQILRDAEGRSAILVRKRDALADIVPALKAAGIRYRAIEIERLGEKQVVRDLYALARALSHLGDRVAWLSILRAPWCGLSLQQLYDIAGSSRHATIWELIKDDLFLERFTRILAPAIANRGRGTLRDRVEGVWLALGGPACVEDATDLEDAEIFLDELERLEHAGAIEDPAALAERLENLYALPDVAAGDDDLQIMTIHKAKGLEFDTVIVPGLDRGPGRSDPPLFLWKEIATGGLLLAPIKETGTDKD